MALAVDNDDEVAELLVFERYYQLNCINEPIPYDHEGLETEENQMEKREAWFYKFRGQCRAGWTDLGSPTAFKPDRRKVTINYQAAAKQHQA